MTDRVKVCEVGSMIGRGFAACGSDAVLVVSEVAGGPPFNLCGWHAVRSVVDWVDRADSPVRD